MLLLVLFVSLFGPFPAGLLQAKADSIASVSTAGNEIKVGETITVYLLFSSTEPIRGVYANILYDPTILRYVEGDASGDTGSLVISDMRGEDYTEFNYVLTFEALMTGESIISIAESGLYNAEAVKIDSPLGSATVRITESGYLSDDATISQISLSYGTLVPAFSPDVDHYTIDVPNEITSISIYVDTTDPRAGVEINGSANLAEGENTRVLQITAQNGDTKEYTIVIRRAAGSSSTSQPESSVPESAPEVSRPESLVMTKVGGISMYVHSIPDNYPIPQGFSKVLYPLQDIPFDIVQNAEGTLKLVYLTDYKEEAGDLFYYNERLKDCEACVPVFAAQQAYLIFDSKKLTKVPDDYSRVTIRVGEHQLSAFAKNGSASLTSYVVYAAGKDGKKSFYNYDSKKKTMSLYTGKLGDAHDASEVSHEESSGEDSEEESKEDPNYGVVENPTKPSDGLLRKLLPYLLLGAGLVVLIILVLIVLISRSIRRGKNEKAGKDVYDDGFSMNPQVRVPLDTREKKNYERWSNTQVLNKPRTKVTENTISMTPVRPKKVQESWKEQTTRMPAVKMNAVHTVSIQEVTRKIPKVYSEKAKQPPRRKVPYGMEPGKNITTRVPEASGKKPTGKKSTKTKKLNADDFYM